MACQESARPIGIRLKKVSQFEDEMKRYQKFDLHKAFGPWSVLIASYEWSDSTPYDTRYKMALTVHTRSALKAATPLHFAIWLENASLYHIKTLHMPQDLTDD